MAVTLSSDAEWRVFPPPVKRAPLSVGDEVFVRTKSAKEVGKKGIICAFENVEVQAPAVAAPDNTAGSGGPTSKEEAPAGGGGSGSGSGNAEGAADTRRREADRTIKWRDVKKQKRKKKKVKKWEDTRAVVRIPPRGDNSNGNPFDCRIRPSRLVPIYRIPPTVDRSTGTAGVVGSAPPPLLLLVTAETAPYRVLAASQVRPSDRVLEIGCSTGETTAVLVKYVPRGNVVAFDVGADMVERTKERLKLAADSSSGSSNSSNTTCARVAVHKIDPFFDPRGAVEAASALLPGREDDDSSAESQVDASNSTAAAAAAVDTSRSRDVDVVFIDIGGNREVRGVVRMIAFVRTAFVRPPRLIVVKSQALVAELSVSPNTAIGMADDDDHDDGAATLTMAAKNIDPGSCADYGKIMEGDVWFRGLLESSATTTAVATSSASDVERTAKGGPGEEGDTSNGSSQHPNIPKHFHPNKAPLRLSPTDGVTPICRYHNYHREGCKKGERCPFEHAVCHWCLRPGHVARSCEDVGEFSALQ